MNVLPSIQSPGILTSFRSQTWSPIIKTTIEIADNLLARSKARARTQHITLRSLIEESLAATLDQPLPATKVSPVTFKGNGLSREFGDASWDRIRDAIC